MNWGPIIFASVGLYMAVFGAIGMWIATQCGRDSNEGALLGAFLGPLGLIIEGLLPKFPSDAGVRDALNDATIRRSG